MQGTGSGALPVSWALHRTHKSLWNRQCAACQSDSAGVADVTLFSFHLPAPIQQTLFSQNISVQGKRQQQAKPRDRLCAHEGSSSPLPELPANIIKLWQ